MLDVFVCYTEERELVIDWHGKEPKDDALRKKDWQHEIHRNNTSGIYREPMRPEDSVEVLRRRSFRRERDEKEKKEKQWKYTRPQSRSMTEALQYMSIMDCEVSAADSNSDEKDCADDDHDESRGMKDVVNAF